MLSYLKWGAVAGVSVTCLIITGCGSDSGTSVENVPGTEQLNGSPAAENAGAPAIDACSLISADDISGLLGVPVAGAATEGGCMWENPANYESVFLEIGSPNTAAGGTLAPPEPGFPEVGTPGPDGMRFLGGGSVEFPAGGRANLVQVAVLSMLGEQADAAAVELARKVTPQIPE